MFVLFNDVRFILSLDFLFRVNAKRKSKDEKFGFGGKKRGSKRNTKATTNDVSDFRRPSGAGKKIGKGSSKRPGKDRRKQMKSRKK